MSEATRGAESGEERGPRGEGEAGRHSEADGGRERGADPEVVDREAVAERTRERTERVIRENRNFAADYLNSFSCGLAAMATTLAEEGRTESSAQADRAARELGRASARIRDESMMDLAREAQERARSRPAVTFGGAAALGFALSRILKSSSGRQGREEEESRGNA